MSKFSALLEQLTKVEGVKEVSLFGEKGEILESTGHFSPDSEKAAELAKKSMTLSGNLGILLKKGKAVRSYLEFSDFNVTMDFLFEQNFLAVLASPQVNLERLRFEIKRGKTLLETRKNS